MNEALIANLDAISATADEMAEAIRDDDTSDYSSFNERVEALQTQLTQLQEEMKD